MAIEIVHCPRCQAALDGRRECWLCHYTLTDAEIAAGGNPYAHPLPEGEAERPVSWQTPYQPPRPIGESRAAGAIGWLLIVGLVLVLGVLILVAPGLGILVAITAAPALIRTAVVVARKRRAGAEVSLGEKSIVFFASLAAVVTACVAAGTAFAITCIATCFGFVFLESTTRSSRVTQQASPMILVLAGLVGLFCGGWTLYAFWRRKDARTS